MLTLTHPTHAALLEAIRAEPADDTVRLALADWYEENGDPAWAELIRVQVELARDHTCEWRAKNKRAGYVDCKEWNELLGPGRVMTWCPTCANHKRLTARSDALLREHEPRWRRGAKCERCGGEKYDPKFRYAIPSHMTECPTCRGTGWSRWWLVERIPVVTTTQNDGWGWRHPVHFVRGFITQVDANLADIFDADGKATEWALAVVRGEPGLRRLWPMDKYPADREQVNERWYWFKMTSITLLAADLDEAALMSRLPAWLFERLPGVDKNTIGMPYTSPPAANTALATAAWQVVREQISG